MISLLLIFSLLINAFLLSAWLANRYRYVTVKLKRFIKKMLVKLKLREDQSHLIANTPIVYYAKDQCVSYLTEKKGVIAKELPNSLIIKPGHYRFANQLYDLTKEGLYRFLIPEKTNRQRIVYQQEIDTLLSSLIWARSHGELHDTLSYRRLLTKAKREKLILTCESTVKFTHKLLSSLSIRSRVVGTRAMNNWNSYDSGHYMLEVYRDDLKQWVLYDIDTGVVFVRDNKLLSLLDLIETPSSDYTIKFITKSIPVSIAPTKQQYNYAFFHESRLANLLPWYKRVMQLTYFEDETINVSCHKPAHYARSFPKGIFPTIQYLDFKSFACRYYQ